MGNFNSSHTKCQSEWEIDRPLIYPSHRVHLLRASKTIKYKGVSEIFLRNSFVCIQKKMVDDLKTALSIEKVALLSRVKQDTTMVIATS